MAGKLYIIGVGPGDPGLLTLRAAELLQAARRVFVPVSGQGRSSLAFEIIQEHIPPDASITELVFPMTLDRQAMDAAYRKNYLLVSSVLRAGDDAVLVTIGDPALYSTAWQVYNLVQEHAPEAACEVVPGISSFSLAAARAGIQLTQGSECLAVVSSYNDLARLERIIDCADSVVFLKTYRSRDMLIGLLQRRGLLGCCVYIRRCGLPDEEIVRDLSALPDEAEYFSLIILRKEGLQ